MPRPRTPIGTFGDIYFEKAPGGRWRALTRFRDHDGVLRRVQATAASQQAAARKLKELLAQRAEQSVGHGELDGNSSFIALVDVWLADLDLENKVAESTRALYERNMRQLVMPAFEHFTLREISVRKVDQFLKTLAATKSYSTAKQARTVLSLAFGLAVRYDALRENPVRFTARSGCSAPSTTSTTGNDTKPPRPPFPPPTKERHDHHTTRVRKIGSGSDRPHPRRAQGTARGG